MRLYDHVDDVAVVEEESQSSPKKKDFYDFESKKEESDTEDTVESEARAYLSKAKKVADCLHNYPIIKRLFLKYNTISPSSAPVERLFSLESLVLTPKHNKLTDARFEKLLLMLYNKNFLEL